MSWQEKIEKYQTEQEETARRVAEIKKRNVLEKLPPLFAVLGKLGSQELLTQMRDEVWKLGEVSVLPKLDEVTAETPILAGACLMAEWPFYLPAGGFGEHDYSSRITISCHRLSIVAQYGGCRLVEDSDDILLGVTSDNWIPPQGFFTNGPFFKASELNAKFLLEKLLVEDILKRKHETPYDGKKEQAERRVIRAIIEEGLKPPKGFEYLLELAEAAKAPHRSE